jgi:RNA polymerase sigma-70 factor (ECF subfamily)
MEADQDRDPWQLAFEKGAAAWPAVRLSWAQFQDHARSLNLGPAPKEAFLADVYLAAAALAGDVAGLAALEARFILPARSSVERVHKAPDFADDVLQELRRKLLLPPDPRLARYAGRSPLEGWIRVTAGRLAFDMARSDVFRVRDDQDRLAEMAAAVADADLELLKRSLGEAFQGALRETLAALSSRERNILRLHVVQGLGIDDLARPYGIHRATAARWLNEIKSKVLKGVRERVVSDHRELSDADLDSLQRLVLSQLHLSLMSPLPAPP